MFTSHVISEKEHLNWFKKINLNQMKYFTLFILKIKLLEDWFKRHRKKKTSLLVFLYLKKK